MFTKATKTQRTLRLALMGPSGAGKTLTALRFAQVLGARIAVIDTEHGSSQLYADRFAFDVAVLERHHPHDYVNAIHAAERAGYDVLLIDSLSHAWMGRGGVLEQKEAAAKRKDFNDYTAWSVATPLHNDLLDAILTSPLHIIATLRVKTAYTMEEYVDRAGHTRSRPVKVGLQPIQRDGVEHEFDIIADLTIDHTLVVTKSRMDGLSGRVIERPDARLAQEIAAWLDAGEAAPIGASFTPVNGTGGYDREKLLSRIHELAQRAAPLGISFDAARLADADEATLVQIGQELRAQVDHARSQQHGATAAADVETKGKNDVTG